MTEQTYNEKTIYEILSNYFWMIKEIERLDAVLDETEFNGTAQYGEESAMPKAKGGVIQDAIANEVTRREKKNRRRIRLLHKVEFIQERMDRIQDEREKVVLDCLLDGMSINRVSSHLGLTRRHIHNLRKKIVERMLE